MGRTPARLIGTLGLAFAAQRCASSVSVDAADASEAAADALTDVAGDSACTIVRQVSPMSTSWSSSPRPVLRIAPGSAPGTVVDVCRDRTCSHVLATLAPAPDGTATPTVDVPVGAVFWRVRTVADTCSVTPAWEVEVSAPSAGSPSPAWGSNADLDGDGFSDAILAGWRGSPHVFFVRGSASGIDWTQAAEVLQPADGIGDLISRAGDVDGDGFGDVVLTTVSPAGDGFIVLFGGPRSQVGSRLQRVDLGGVAPFLFPTVVGAGDTDGDGYGDVAALDRHSGMLTIFRGGPSGLVTSNPWSSHVANVTFPDLPAQVLTGMTDLNADGFADVAVAGLATGSQRPFVGIVLGGHGAPAISTVDAMLAPPMFGPTMQIGSPGDVNADGVADIVLLAGCHEAELLLGSQPGGGVLLAPHEFCDVPLAGSDIDGDGYLDIVDSDGQPGSFTVYFGARGSAALSRTQRVVGPADFGAAIASGADFDGDGFADALVSAPANQSVYVRYGSPSGLIARGTDPPFSLRTNTVSPLFGQTPLSSATLTWTAASSPAR